MTIPPPVTHAVLSFQKLVRYLSHPRYLPSSLEIRNKLLRTYSFPRQWTGSMPDPEPWKTFYSEIDEGFGVWAFGNVPQEVKNDASEDQRVQNGFDNLWALVILTSDRPVGSALPPHRSTRHVPRVDLWISSEHQLNRYDPEYNNKALDATTAYADRTDPDSSEIRDLIAREMTLFKHIALQWLPNKLQELQRPTQAEAAGNKASLPILFCSLAQRFSSLLVSHVHNRAPIPNPLPERQDVPMLLDMAFENPCVTYVRSVPAGPAPRLQPAENSGWTIDEMTDEDVEIVQKSNKLMFPTTYIQSHRCISTMIRRSPNANTIPASMSDNSSDSELPVGPVGWCYAHDVLSIASLFTVPALRRQRIPLASTFTPPSSSPSTSGIARLVVDDFAFKARTAQLRALQCSGAFEAAEMAALSDSAGSDVGEDPVACVAVSEVPNPSRAFFEHVGFRPSHGCSWTQITFNEA